MKLLLIIAMAVFPLLASSAENREYVILLHGLFGAAKNLGALARGLAGSVDLEFTIAPNGDVTDIAIRAAQPQGVFEQAAVAALSHSRYRPVERDGKSSTLLCE